mmetsp:Transcript_8794/g.22973  ORF Transcript_8794/g.22973 Transcript_8794/m.22973 type:complete len:202 (+) Transcript_8794:96-701(+)
MSWLFSSQAVSTKPNSNPPLAGKPHELVATLGGPLGDYTHDADALARATALAKGEHAATFSFLLMRIKGCFGYSWKLCWAIVIQGSVYIFDKPTDEGALKVLTVSDCQCEVGEREECKEGLYCFGLRHAADTATFCAFDSKSLLLWLQALQAGGVKYEEPLMDVGGITTILQLSAMLLTGEQIDLTRYEGCVCLVVNAASK